MNDDTGERRSGGSQRIKRTENHNPKAITSLDQVRGSKVCRFRCPRPPGYAATTWTHVGGIKVITLLDSCVTASGISEEIACLLISYFDAEVEAGRLAAEAHPVRSISKYDEILACKALEGK